MGIEQTGRVKRLDKVEPVEVAARKAHEDAVAEAGLIAGSAIVVLQLLGAVSKRLRWMAPTLVFVLAFRNDLDNIVRMLRAYYEGRYKNVPYSTLLKLLGAVVFFASTIEIPIIGVIDNALMVGWVIRSVRKDIDAFLLWETENPAIVNV